MSHNIVVGMKFVAISFLVGVFFAACGEDGKSVNPNDDDLSILDSSSSLRAQSSSGALVKYSSSKDEKNSKNLSSSVKSELNDKSSSSLREMVESSSSLGVSSSSVVLAVPCKTETEDNCEYGSLTDERDGRIYKTVKIGDQWWMAENLKYRASNSSCYNNLESNCDKFGRLYMLVEGTILCPNGWHLPLQMEWEVLFTAVGGRSTAGKVLKSQSGWSYNNNGTDAYSFAAIPAGYEFRGLYYNASSEANFWCRKDGMIDGSYNERLYYGDNADLSYHRSDFELSVRCVKD